MLRLTSDLNFYTKITRHIIRITITFVTGNYMNSSIAIIFWRSDVVILYSALMPRSRLIDFLHDTRKRFPVSTDYAASPNILHGRDVHCRKTL